MSTTMSKKGEEKKAVAAYTDVAVEKMVETDSSLDVDLLKAIIKPKRQILVEVPVRRDDGTYVTYQAPVSGRFEVFTVQLPSGTPSAISSNSGAGRRFPHAGPNGVVYQKPVAGKQELFVYAIAGGSTSQLTTGSGSGDRMGRWAHDGLQVSYEVRAGGLKEVWVATASAGLNGTLITTGDRGNRLPGMSQDGEVVYQDLAGNLEVFRIDQQGQNLTPMSNTSLGGLRRPSIDRHGHVVVFQAPSAAGPVEVFSTELCQEAAFRAYGQHGTPSTGSLQSFQQWFRCDLTLGLDSALSAGTTAIFLLGDNQLLPGQPFLGAPGNFLYTTPLLAATAPLDANGDARLTISVSALLSGVVYYQWALLDAAANGPGIVLSEGVELGF